MQDARALCREVGATLLRALPRRRGARRHVPRIAPGIPERSRQSAGAHVRRALRWRHADPARAQALTAYDDRSTDMADHPLDDLAAGDVVLDAIPEDVEATVAQRDQWLRSLQGGR